VSRHAAQAGTVLAVKHGVKLRPFAFAVIAALSSLLTSAALMPVFELPFLDGFVFGALLAGYLWLYQGVRERGLLAGLVAASGGAFVLTMFAVIPLQVVPELFPAAGTSIWGPGATPFSLSGILGASVVATAFLLMVPHQSLTGATLGRIAVCSGAGGALGLLGFIVTMRFGATRTYLPLLMIWQAGMALVLVWLAERADVTAEHPAPNASRSGALLPVGPLVLVAALFALTGLGCSWLLLRHTPGQRSLARLEQKHALWLAEAPSRENLPPLLERPLGDAFARNIGGLTLQGTVSVQRELPPRGLLPGHAPPPEHLVYFARYEGEGDAAITVWQYPTKEWARYETRHIIGCTERAVGSHRVLSSELETFWLSDDMMIRVTGQQAERDKMLAVYLARYPSDMEASFPLFSLAEWK
jgi:hypothetical protein